MFFYDVTTLCFEIDQEDKLRKNGLYKNGKHQNPQIVLGLLVSKDAYLLAYEIFAGNQFEGHTMLPIIYTFKQKYNLDKIIVVADSGLMSKSNIDLLVDNNYEFIIGARIKNESNEIKEQILNLELTDAKTAIVKNDNLNLIVSHSDKQASKDKHIREKGLKRLEKKVKTGKLSKNHINNRGYNFILLRFYKFFRHFTILTPPHIKESCQTILLFCLIIFFFYMLTSTHNK